MTAQGTLGGFDLREEVRPKRKFNLFEFAPEMIHGFSVQVQAKSHIFMAKFPCDIGWDGIRACVTH